MNAKPSMLKAALIGGGALGVAGGLPLIGALNCACCALVIAGGFLAAYIYSKDAARAAVGFRPGNGAMVGLVASPFYALASTIVSAVASLAFGPQDMSEMVRQMEEGGAPPEAVEWVERFTTMAEGPAGWIFGFFIALLLAVVFSTIGGLIGGAVFKHEPPVQVVPPGGSVPPPPPPPSREW
jgi:hypothetical protein